MPFLHRLQRARREESEHLWLYFLSLFNIIIMKLFYEAENVAYEHRGNNPDTILPCPAQEPCGNLQRHTLRRRGGMVLIKEASKAPIHRPR